MKPRIGIIATSSVVPRIEFERGIEAIRQTCNAEIEVDGTVLGQHYFYTASDENRARAFWKMACRKDIDAIWCARGGYGATHLLPMLARLSQNKLPPQKTLLGFSDVTALHEFVRKKWKWHTIHSPMPSLKSFADLSNSEQESYRSLLAASLGEPVSRSIHSANSFRLEWILPPKKKIIEAPLVGGNLAVWLSLVGTPYVGQAKNKILFFEEIGENLARINRYLHQLEQAGGFKDVQAIVLGDFTDCRDTVPMRLDPTDSSQTRLIPLRASYPDAEGLRFVFKELALRTRIPVAYGLPVGHGTQHHSLWLGKRYQLKSDGSFSLV